MRRIKASERERERGRERPDWLALGGVVDLAEFRAVGVAAAAEAVGEPRRLSVVGVVGRHVTAMTAAMRLHLASTVDRALVARAALLRAPANRPTQRPKHVCAGV